jgi:RND family efflux transporter MFP subunit
VTSTPAFKAVVLTVAAIIVGPACRRAPDPAATAPQGVSVTAEVVRLETLRETVNVPGTVVPSSAGEVLVVPPGPALVTEIGKKEGEAVAVGDVLARFDVASITQELNARELDVAEATSRLNRATEQMDKQSGLFDRGLTPRNVMEAAKAELTSAQFALSQATAGREAARAHQDIAVVRARQPGVVSKIFHAAGEMVSGSQNDPVMRVVDPTKVQVTVQVPVAQLGRVGPGQIATISMVGSLAGEPATVVFKPQMTDANLPTGEVRLNFGGATPLAVDTAVSVEILIDERKDALAVSPTAVRRDESGTFVVIAGEDGRAHRRPVRVGLALRDRVELASGVTAGERVLVSGFDMVSEGTAIVIER